MEIKAKLNYLRMTPRKVRSVADLIRGMGVEEAQVQLKFISKRTSGPLLKLLDSAVANAKNNFKLEKDTLYIKEITVNEGPPFKRLRPVSRGRAFPIMKRTSHVNLVLETKEESKVEEKREKAEEKKEPELEKIKETPQPTVSQSKGGKLKPPKKIIKKPGFRGLAKKIFRRKSF